MSELRVFLNDRESSAAEGDAESSCSQKLREGQGSSTLEYEGVVSGACI